MNTKAFTLIELLVVIAILAVLAVAVTLILNPAELIRQGRDSTRLSDLATINRALGLYQTDQIAKWMGTSTVVYTSLPDTTSTCASYGLPSLPSGWTYNCVQSSSSTKVDGSGWLPVDFTSMSFSSPLARLPLDPVNNATTSKYYTYVSGGSWKLSAVFESETRAVDSANDGGLDPATYEVGTDLELAPFTHGLVGYWAFDDGSGTTASDSSGYSNDGTMYSSSTITDLHTSSGCKSGSCASFDGDDDYVEFDPNKLNLLDRTFSVWAKTSYSGKVQELIASSQGLDGNQQFRIETSGEIRYYNGGSPDIYTSGVNANDGNWHHILMTSNDTNAYIYVDGILKGSATGSGFTTNKYYRYIGARTGMDVTSKNTFFNGSIDDVRIYNRALSAAEVEAMYNSY